MIRNRKEQVVARLPSTRKADHRACTDPSLRAAQEGWGTTLRYGLLRLARPAAVGAAGGAAGVSGALVGYAKTRGWL